MTTIKIFSKETNKWLDSREIEKLLESSLLDYEFEVRIGD